MTAAAMAHRAVAGPTEEQMYLDALNVCFPDWGDRAMFDWCFKRESAGLRPDLFWLWADGHSVAGTANTYRRLELPNGRTSVAAIMTGSWTLPAARGLGAFTRIIRESRDLAAARRVALLLAFTRAGNVSFGRLREAGAALFPTGYCRSTSQPPAEGTRWCESPIETVDMGRFCGREMGAVRFVYEPHEWRDQFVQRPSDITHVSSAHRWSAIVERMPQADRLLALAIEPGFASTQVWSEAVRALTARASSTGRRLFCFTTDARRTADMAELGFEVVAGFLTALIADEAALRTALALDSRVSSAQSQALADPASAWFLGRWSVQNGDRM